MKRQIAKTLVALREREREQHFTRKEVCLLFKLISFIWSKGGSRATIESKLLSRDIS